MKTQKQNTNLTKKQRLKNRKKQVRIQKLILASVCILLLGIAVLRPVYNHKQKNYTINSTCEGYRSKVETEAANYDMSDYVDLILALMMQESSGQGTDVMQSSEGAYNTKYPQSPNGITDIDYSISCGIQELKYALNKAGVTGLMIWIISDLHFRGTISVQMYTSIISKKTESPPGLSKVPKLSPKSPAARLHVPKKIHCIPPPDRGTTETNIIPNTYYAIIIFSPFFMPELYFYKFFKFFQKNI